MNEAWTWERDGEPEPLNPVERLLEMLHAYFPGVDFGVKARTRPKEPRGGGAQPRQERQEQQVAASRDVDVDPVLARCYAELGVSYGTDLKQVRRAWKRLMRQHHPDVQGGDPERQRLATEQAKQLNGAFEEIGRRLRGDGSRTTRRQDHA
jgi:DnaJ domain